METAAEARVPESSDTITAASVAAANFAAAMALRGMGRTTRKDRVPSRRSSPRLADPSTIEVIGTTIKNSVGIALSLYVSSRFEELWFAVANQTTTAGIAPSKPRMMRRLPPRSWRSVTLTMARKAVIVVVPDSGRRFQAIHPRARKQ